MSFLPSASEFRNLVSGQQRGVKASLTRMLLRGAEVPYSLAVRWRNRQYETGKKPVQQVAVPVVSVGNLTLGGTGKTPMVEWIARWFRQQDLRVTLISRGYGAEAGARNDEAMELEQRLPDVPHLQNPDRVEAARTAIEEFECQVILLDDAFQHRRIHRDLDIVLLDALEPFGHDHVFPRGTLREPTSGLKRAQCIVLSRADMVSADERAAIRKCAQQLAPNAVWVEATHEPQYLLGHGQRRADLESLRGRPVGAFCGLGNPAGFRHTLTSCGLQLAELREFPDHYNYQRSDVEGLARWGETLPIDALVCTHKDLVKVGAAQLGRRPLWALVIGLRILSGQSELENLLHQCAEQARRSSAET